ncbi:hypothetical protein [Thalassospira marina]|nr:hypothetical protein [Thalassospira marina]
MGTQAVTARAASRRKRQNTELKIILAGKIGHFLEVNMPVQMVRARELILALGIIFCWSVPCAQAQETPDIFNTTSPPAAEQNTASDGDATGARAEKTATATSPTASRQASTDKPALKMQLSFVDEVAVGKDAQVRARITDPSIGTQDMRNTVQLVGTVKSGEPVEGLVPSSIAWAQIQRTDTAASSQLQNALESRFRISETMPVINSNEMIYAEGDVDGLVTSAMSLMSDDAAVADTPVSSARTAPGGDAGKYKTSGNGQAENSAFKDINIPDPEKETPQLAKAEDVIAETTMGCDILVDLEGGVAKQQSQKLVNGSPQGGCSPNGTNYPLARSYASCQDIVDMNSHKAWASYKRFYVDNGGTNQVVDSECQKDVELVYDIFQKPDECTYEVDLVNNMVFERGKWVYQSKNISSAWNEIEVTGCQRMESSTIPLTETEDGCTPRHDFVAGISHQQTRLYYVEGGQHKMVSECTDSGKTYPHIKNTTACEDLAPTKVQLGLESGNRVVFKQSRIEIMVDDQAVAITDCAPDDSQSTTAFQDAAGCETTFYHYLSSGQSYGAARWKYKFPGEPEIVLSECLQDNDLLYVHQVRVAGYENNDEALVSFPKTEIYIDTPNDKLVVSEAQVREGAAEIPYTFQKNMKVSTGEIFYEDGSCTKMMNQNSVDRYLRGDGISTFDNILGEAESLNQGNGCTTAITWGPDYHDQYQQPTNWQTQNVCGSYSYTDYRNEDHVAQATDYYHCSWTLADGKKTVKRDDGEVIGEVLSNTCKSAPKQFIRSEPNNPSFIRTISWYGGWSYPTLSAVDKSNCATTWGWQ